jgi:hypothetical protein
MKRALGKKAEGERQAALEKPVAKRGSGGKRLGSGRKKGTPNKSTAAKHWVRLYQLEAIAAQRGVCADPKADATAKVQASLRLLDLLPSQLQEEKQLRIIQSEMAAAPLARSDDDGSA